MALDQVKNFCIVEVSTGYNSTDTSIVLKTGDGAKLPDPASGEYNLVWYDNTSYLNPTEDPNVEIVRVTALSTNTLTVTRNQEGSGASTKNTADKTYKMILSLTKKMLDDIGSNFDGIVGGTTPADGSFTTLSASGLISADGGQIKFPASQSASADANTLDDYEEGTFTTTLTASTSGTITVAEAENTGQYIKIGKMCFVSGFIEVTSVSSPIGTLIMNLPFTVDDTSDYSSRTTGTVLAVNLTAAKSNQGFICYESEAQTRMWSTDGLTLEHELAGYIQANTTIHFSISFRTSN